MVQKLDELGPGTIGYLAGWLEGEGSFVLNQGRYPQVSAQSVDSDTLQTVAETVGGSVTGPYTRNRKRGNEQAFYGWQIRGNNAIELMKIVYPLMSFRRKKQIEKCVSNYKPFTKEQRSAKAKLTWRNQYASAK